MKRNTFFLFLIVLLSSAIGFLFGSHQINQNNAANFSNPSIEKLNRLMNYLSEDYVDKINTDSLVSVVIEDIVDELDPHSVYIPVQQRQALSESMQGNFEGIGVQFFIKNDTIAVIRVLEGGPSQKAGLKSGDRILMADQDTLYAKGKTNQEIIARLKGPSGDPVQLTVYRKKNDSIYIFSDGFVDQFGGEKEKKFKSVNFKKLILSLQESSMDKQKELLNQEFMNWKGDLEQIDYVCIIGFSF